MTESEAAGGWRALISGSKPYRKLLASMGPEHRGGVSCGGVIGSMAALLAQVLQEDLARPVLLVVPTEDSALALREDIRFLSGSRSWEMLSKETSQSIVQVLKPARRGELLGLVGSVAAVSSPVPHPKELKSQSLELARGTSLSGNSLRRISVRPDSCVSPS